VGYPTALLCVIMFYRTPTCDRQKTTSHMALTQRLARLAVKTGSSCNKTNTDKHCRHSSASRVAVLRHKFVQPGKQFQRVLGSHFRHHVDVQSFHVSDVFARDSHVTRLVSHLTRQHPRTPASTLPSQSHYYYYWPLVVFTGFSTIFGV